MLDHITCIPATIVVHILDDAYLQVGRLDIVDSVGATLEVLNGADNLVGLAIDKLHHIAVLLLAGLNGEVDNSELLLISNGERHLERVVTLACDICQRIGRDEELVLTQRTPVGTHTVLTWREGVGDEVETLTYGVAQLAPRQQTYRRRVETCQWCSELHSQILLGVDLQGLLEACHLELRWHGRLYPLGTILLSLASLTLQTLTLLLLLLGLD